MKKSELVSVVLEIVECETEVNVNEIVGRCRNSEVVDARHIAVMVLHRTGMYAASVAEALGVSTRYVQNIVSAFEDRTRYNPGLRKNYETVLNKLRSRLE